jgi:hypothetical protein
VKHVPVGQHVARYLRQASQAVEAAVARILPGAGPRVPVLDPGRWEAPGSATPGPAGWFALAVEAGRSGFLLGGRPVAAADLAEAIWHCPRWRGRPVLLVTQASAPADGAGPVLRQLAVELGAPVYASDGGIRFIFGRALAGGLFWCWRPDGGDEPEPAGPLLPLLGQVRPHRTLPGRERYPQQPSPVPPPPSGLAALEVRGLTIPAIEVPRFDLDIRRVVLPEFQSPQSELGTGRPAVVAALPSTQDTVPAAAPPAPRDRPVAGWFGVRARTDEADRERLRAVLDWKFQSHSRVVARALSLHPGLRSSVGAYDVIAGLVAVLALLDGVCERVNDALRGGAKPDEDVQLLARCACAGLGQLPAIGGPVFAAAPAGLEVASRYRPGELVVEPAFTAVSLTGSAERGVCRYAIWSATARRLDQLGTPGGPGARTGQAMFAAGTRFAVLGVDDGPAGPPCVLLREIVFGHRDGGLDERVATKLRDALAGQAQGAPASLPWPLGRAASGLPFAPEPAATAMKE